MRHRRLLLTPLLACAPLLAGCGGVAAVHTAAPAAPAPTRTASAAPLRVAATDLRLGDASLARAGRPAVQLRVGPRHVDPDRLDRPRPDRDGVGAGATCPDQDLLPAPGNLATIAASTLCLLNGERADAGLPALTTDGRLAAAAVSHARDMVARQYFDHRSPEGRDVVDRLRGTGYIPADRAWLVGENLAWGTGTLASPRRIMAAWMASPGHRENILRPGFREIGLGIVPGNPRAADGAGATYATTFGALGDPPAAARRSARARKAAAQRRARAARVRAARARRARIARQRAKAARHGAARRTSRSR